MDERRYHQLRQLLTLTEEILSDAREKNWDSMMEKERARRLLMEQFFQQKASDQERHRIEEMIRQIITLDKKIVALAEAGKLEILKKMRDLSAGQQAIDAYADNAG